MLGLGLLVLIVVWGGLSVALGIACYRLTNRRWAQVLATAIVFMFPFWDVPFGIYEFNQLKAMAGVRVDRTAIVDGFLDENARDWNVTLTELRSMGYRYLEFYQPTADRADQSLTPDAGYYQVRLEPNGNSACARFESLPQSQIVKKRLGLDDMCVAIAHSDAPLSQYKYETVTEKYAGSLAAVPPVETHCQQIEDLVGRSIIARQCTVVWQSSLGRWWYFGFPIWFADWDSNGSTRPLRVGDVLISGAARR